jgi:hypothetical protein
LSGVFSDRALEETTLLNPLVNESQPRNVERPVASSIEMSNGDARSDEPPNLAAQNKHVMVASRRPAPGNQAAGLQPPLLSVTLNSGNARQNGRTEPISEPVDAIAARAKKNDVDNSEAPDKVRYQPLTTAGGSNANGPPALWKVSSPLAPGIRKEAGDLSSSSGLPGREPDEIQIHIGRIEVTAVAQAMPRPAPPPVRKSISLDDYLKRSNGRSK